MVQTEALHTAHCLLIFVFVGHTSSMPGMFCFAVAHSEYGKVANCPRGLTLQCKTSKATIVQF